MKIMDQEKISAPNLMGNMELSVRALLVAHNIKQLDLAKKYFVHPSTINRVIQGKRKTHYIRQIIAQELGKKVEDLWGKNK
jgi:transcriptional regulator with XRE-family HTH domain